MSKDTIKKLKAELKAAQAKRKQELEEAVEVISIKQEIDRASNPLVLRMQIQERNNKQLDAMLDYLETELDIVIRPVYGYGNIVSKLLTIARSVMYCKFEQKSSALIATKLNEAIIEDLLDVLGSTCYYSKEARKIVPAVPCNYKATADLLELMASTMGLVNADLSKFNTKTIDYQYSSAELRARQMMENSLELEDGQEDVVYED